MSLSERLHSPNLGPQSGMSLVEVLVAVTLLGTITLGVLQLQNLLTKSNNTNKAHSEETRIFNEVLLYLADKEGCRQTFNGLAPGAQVPAIKNKSGDDRLVLNQEFKNEGLKIIDMTTVGTVPPNSNGEIELRIKFERTRNVAGAKHMNKKATLVVNTDASGNIVSCYQNQDAVVGTALSESCTMMGGVYDEATQMCDLIDFKMGVNPSNPCSAANEGKMRYDSTNKVMQFCNGVTWKNMQETPATPAPTPAPVNVRCRMKINSMVGACSNAFGPYNSPWSEVNAFSDYSNWVNTWNGLPNGCIRFALQCQTY